MPTDILVVSDRADVRKHAIPWWHVGPTTTSSPFTRFGLAWCPRCQTEVTTDTQSVHGGTTFAYRERCERCGRVIAYGLFDHVPMLTDTPLPAAAVEWTFKPGRDRR